MLAGESFMKHSLPTDAEMEANAKSFIAVLHSLLIGFLWAARTLADFLIGHMGGAPPGEASIFLNVRIGNRERAVKEAIASAFEANVAEALKAVNPFGFRRLLSNAAGELAGNLAALASSDEELARGVGEALVAAFAGSGETLAGGGDTKAAQCHAAVVFVKGPLCVLRVRLSVSSEGVASLLALTAGPTAADWWRFGVHELLPGVCLGGTAAARLIDAAARTTCATLLCRQCASAVPAALTESLRSQVVGLHIDAQPTPPSAEADYLFELIGRHEHGNLSQAAAPSA